MESCATLLKNLEYPQIWRNLLFSLSFSISSTFFYIAVLPGAWLVIEGGFNVIECLLFFCLRLPLWMMPYHTLSWPSKKQKNNPINALFHAFSLLLFLLSWNMFIAFPKCSIKGFWRKTSWQGQASHWLCPVQASNTDLINTFFFKSSNYRKKHLWVTILFLQSGSCIASFFLSVGTSWCQTHL